MNDLKDAAFKHTQLVAEATDADKDDVESSAANLLDKRLEAEDAIDAVKRLPKGVRKATLDYLKEIAPSDVDKALDGYYRGRYRYSSEGYDNSIRHRYAWKTAFGGADDIGLRAPIAFHKEIAKQAKLILNPEKSWFQKNPVTNAILGISTQAKQSLLSLSGFHWVQEGLRGLPCAGLKGDRWFFRLPVARAVREAVVLAAQRHGPAPLSTPIEVVAAAERLCALRRVTKAERFAGPRAIAA